MSGKRQLRLVKLKICHFLCGSFRFALWYRVLSCLPLWRVQVLPLKISYVLFPLLLEYLSPEMFKPWLKVEVILHNDTTSWRNPPSSSRISLPLWASLSQGTKVDGFWLKFGGIWSTEVLLSVSFHVVFFTWKTPGEHSRILSSDGVGEFMQVLWKPTSSEWWVGTGLSFSSTKGHSVCPLARTRFLGDGGSCFPLRILSSCPRFHSAWSDVGPVESRARLLSLGVLDLCWNKEHTHISWTIFSETRTVLNDWIIVLHCIA